MLATLLLLPLLQEAGFEAELREEPGAHAVLLASGRSGMPDGAVFNLDLFLEDEKEAPLARELVRLRNGEFKMLFDPFPKRERPLAGRYRLLVTYDPGLQPAPLPGVPRKAVEVEARVGSPDDGRREQEAVRERLRSDLRAYGVIGDEIRKELESGKADAKRWTSLQSDWSRRCVEMERRALKDAEFSALKLGKVVNAMETLHGIVRSLGRAAAAGEAGDLREGRERLGVMIDQLIGQVDNRAPAKDEVRTLADEVRKNLFQALHLEGDNLAQARRKFMEALFALNRHVPDEPRAQLLAIARDAASYFEKVPVDRPAAQRLHEELDRRLVDLLNALPPK